MSKKSTISGKKSTPKAAMKRPMLTTEELKSEADYAEELWKDRKRINKLAQEAIRRCVEERAAPPLPAQLISIRLAVADLHDARVMAARKGIGYQTYIRMLLHEALQREKALR
jgi:predicted DNA binding CopG/RHH family protein